MTAQAAAATTAKAQRGEGAKVFLGKGGSKAKIAGRYVSAI